MAEEKKKGRKPDYSGEVKERTVVEIRWHDCFKFWIAGSILALLLTIVIHIGYTVGLP